MSLRDGLRLCLRDSLRLKSRLRVKGDSHNKLLVRGLFRLLEGNRLRLRGLRLGSAGYRVEVYGWRPAYGAESGIVGQLLAALHAEHCASLRSWGGGPCRGWFSPVHYGTLCVTGAP